MSVGLILAALVIFRLLRVASVCHWSLQKEATWLEVGVKRLFVLFFEAIIFEVCQGHWVYFDCVCRRWPTSVPLVGATRGKIALLSHSILNSTPPGGMALPIATVALARFTCLDASCGLTGGWLRLMYLFSIPSWTLRRERVIVIAASHVCVRGSVKPGQPVKGKDQSIISQ